MSYKHYRFLVFFVGIVSIVLSFSVYEDKTNNFIRERYLEQVVKNFAQDIFISTKVYDIEGIEKTTNSYSQRLLIDFVRVKDIDEKVIFEQGRQCQNPITVAVSYKKISAGTAYLCTTKRTYLFSLNFLPFLLIIFMVIFVVFFVNQRIDRLESRESERLINYFGSFDTYNLEFQGDFIRPKNRALIKMNHTFKKLVFDLRKCREEIINNRTNEERVKIIRQLAHDIRSPVSVLKSFIQGRADRDLLEKAVQRIGEMADVILRDNKKKEETLVISQAVAQAVKLKKLEHPGVILEAHLDHQCAHHVKVTPFHRVLSNLINNAVEAHATKIKIVLRKESAKVITLAITDNGEGIQEDLIPLIGKNKISTKKGSGLGTYHAFRTVEDMGGEISYEKLEQGTRVVLSFSDEKHYDFIQIDDDELVRNLWFYNAQSRGMNLLTVASHQEIDFAKIPKKTLIYIDHDLGSSHLNGIEVGKILYAQGYENLYLSTGHNPEEFVHLDFFKGVQGKDFPLFDNENNLIGSSSPPQK